MPEMQLEVRSNRRQMAKALAQAVAPLRDERQAGRKEGRVKRLCELAQEVAAVAAFCIGAFWIVREVLAVWGS